MHRIYSATDPRIVEFLIEKGANPDEPNRFGWRPLHVALSCDHLAIIKILLAHKVCVNAQTSSNFMPLHFAKSVKASQFLVEHGAQITEQISIKNLFGCDNSPLEYHRNCEGHAAIFNYLKLAQVKK